MASATALGATGASGSVALAAGTGRGGATPGVGVAAAGTSRPEHAGNRMARTSEAIRARIRIGFSHETDATGDASGN
ncbi:MAG: hypothetical protein WKG00_02535 [Polyangiaceae bacterium]